MKRTVFSIILTLLAAVCVNAQEETSHFTFQFGGGFTQGLGRTGSYVDTGWNATIGAGWNFNSSVGALINVSDTSLGINSTTLGNIGVPGGTLNMFTATLDPIIHLNPHGHVDVYVTGGGGLFRQEQTFTQPSAATVVGYVPFLGFYPTVVPVNQILGQYSVNKPGIDAGIGIAMGTKWHGKFYAEAKYDRMFNGPYHTDFLPVTFGFRW